MTAFERAVAGDALQLAGLVRDHGPETLHRLMDLWGPDHTRAVCIALAAAVDVDRTPQELWGWLGPVESTSDRTVRTHRLWRDPNRGPGRPTLADTLDTAAVDLRPVDPKRRADRESRRRKRARERGVA